MPAEPEMTAPRVAAGGHGEAPDPRPLSPTTKRPSGVNVGQPLPTWVRTAPRASGKRRVNCSSKPSSTRWSGSTAGIVQREVARARR